VLLLFYWSQEGDGADRRNGIGVIITTASIDLVQKSGCKVPWFKTYRTQIILIRCF